eukprot:gene4603-7985_t
MTNCHTAKCFCGKVEVKITFDKNPIVAHCHCDSCRRFHSSSFFTTVIFNNPTFEVTKGKESIKSFHGNNNGTRNFCGECGGRIFNNFRETMYSIPLTLIEGIKPSAIPSHLEPKVHVCYEEAIVLVPDGKMKFNGIPKPKSFSGMRVGTFIKEYFTSIALTASLGYIFYLKYK